MMTIHEKLTASSHSPSRQHFAGETFEAFGEYGESYFGNLK